MSEKLGPCPLCGGEAIHEEVNTMAPEIAQCEHDGCEMANWMAVETWQKLSALAASEKRLKAEVERLTAREKRMREALERCRNAAHGFGLLTESQASEN